MSFNHSLDRNYTGTTKIQMHSAEMRELTSGQATPPAGQVAAAGVAGEVAGLPATASLPPQPPPASAGVATAGGAVAAGDAGRLPATASAPAAAAAAGGGGAGISSTILCLWRPDAGRSWDDEPLLRMYVVHGGVDAQFVTYEHIEVGGCGCRCQVQGSWVAQGIGVMIASVE